MAMISMEVWGVNVHGQVYEAWGQNLTVRTVAELTLIVMPLLGREGVHHIDLSICGPDKPITLTPTMRDMAVCKVISREWTRLEKQGGYREPQGYVPF